MGLVEQFGRLTHPALHAALLWVIGIVFIYRHRYGIATSAIVSGVLWLALCSAPTFATWLQRGLEQPYAQLAAEDYPKVDAIVVLGGGKLPNDPDWDSDDPDMHATRLGFGLQLFQQGRAGTLLLSGADQALKMAHRLQQQGVPAGALIVEDASRNTHQNALYSTAILRRQKLQNVLLVTSGIHMPRAEASFARQGMVLIPAPAPDEYQGPSSSWWPRRGALTLSARCLREYLGMWVYRVRGWV
jgi:uncharacterized SAM-binding protein YcdF (DUF218 family)